MVILENGLLMAYNTPETKVAIFFPPHLMKKACVLTQALQAEAKFLLQDGSSRVLKFTDRSWREAAGTSKGLKTT